MFRGQAIHLMAAFQKLLTWDLSLIIHLWVWESGQHMFYDVLLIAVKNCAWQEETEASNVPTSPDAPSG